MKETGEIINRVDQSGIITLDLNELAHTGERVLLDISSQLYMGLVLKEKNFRDYISSTDWSVFQGRNVAVICSADAIVPTWAYMLIASRLSAYANKVVFGDLTELERVLYRDAIANLKIAEYEGKRVVIKGCGDKPIPVSAYVDMTNLLTPVVKSLMYGEPCSTVPVYKK